MTEPSIYDLRRERGPYCEWCKQTKSSLWNQAEQRHHALIHDTKRFHAELTVPENLMAVCWQCHTGGCKVNGYDVRLKFWQIQCERYGVDHMEDWVNGLPDKLWIGRRIDFTQRHPARLSQDVSRLGRYLLREEAQIANSRSTAVYRITNG